MTLSVSLPADPLFHAAAQYPHPSWQSNATICFGAPHAEWTQTTGTPHASCPERYHRPTPVWRPLFFQQELGQVSQAAAAAAVAFILLDSVHNTHQYSRWGRWLCLNLDCYYKIPSHAGDSNFTFYHFCFCFFFK